MYCKICGKEIVDGDVNNAVCESCMTPQTVNVETEAQPAQNPRLLGLKKSIAAAVAGYFGMFFTILIYFFAVASIATENNAWSIATLLLLVMVSLPLIVVAFMWGKKSINVFRNATHSKPIATLVLGIHSIVFACFAALWFGMDLLFSVISLMFV